MDEHENMQFSLPQHFSLRGSSLNWTPTSQTSRAWQSRFSWTERSTMSRLPRKNRQAMACAEGNRMTQRGRRGVLPLTCRAPAIRSAVVMYKFTSRMDCYF